MELTLPDILMWGIYACTLYLSSFWLVVLAENRKKVKEGENPLPENPLCVYNRSRI